MLSNRTKQDPPKIEVLGDGTYYYNFDVDHSINEDGEDNYDYKQVRCPMPVDLQQIQEAIDDLEIDHTAQL